MTLTDLAFLVDGELIFEGEEDHADGGEDLGHGDGTNGPMAGSHDEKREGLADIQRPGQKTKTGKNGFGGDAAEDVKDEERSDAMNGALDEGEGPDASDTNAYPEKSSA